MYFWISSNKKIINQFSLLNCSSCKNKITLWKFKYFLNHDFETNLAGWIGSINSNETFNRMFGHYITLKYTSDIYSAIIDILFCCLLCFGFFFYLSLLITFVLRVIWQISKLLSSQGFFYRLQTFVVWMNLPVYLVNDHWVCACLL